MLVSVVIFFFFFFNDTATTEIYTYLHTLSLHDALPISSLDGWRGRAVALALGLVSATGFQPLNLWPLTLAVIALFMMMAHAAQSRWGALALGWWFGLGHFTLGLNWIATSFTYQSAMPVWLGWVGVLLLSLFLAI